MSAPSAIGVLQRRRQKRVVDDDERARAMRGVRDRPNVRDSQQRIARRLDPHEARSTRAISASAVSAVRSANTNVEVLSSPRARAANAVFRRSSRARRERRRPGEGAEARAPPRTCRCSSPRLARHPRARRARRRAAIASGCRSACSRTSAVFRIRETQTWTTDESAAPRRRAHGRSRSPRERRGFWVRSFSGCS